VRVALANVDTYGATVRDDGFRFPDPEFVRQLDELLEYSSDPAASIELVQRCYRAGHLHREEAARRVERIHQDTVEYAELMTEQARWAAHAGAVDLSHTLAARAAELAREARQVVD
jgi:hypothetical protein